MAGVQAVRRGVRGAKIMLCDTCVFYPPSACDGKPCCMCDIDDALFNCYQPASEDGGDEG